MSVLYDQLLSFLINNISVDNIKQLSKSKKVNQEMIDALWQITISNSHPASWRAAWTMHHLINENNIELARPHLHKMLDQLNLFNHNGQKREIMKIILLFDPQEIDMGKALNLSFDILINPSEALAVRVHAMQLIYNISNIETDLKPELRNTIEIIMQEESPAIRGRGKMILKKLKREGY